MHRSIPQPHQVNIITKHQNRNPPIKKITPMCAPVTTLPSLHYETKYICLPLSQILHLQPRAMYRSIAKPPQVNVIKKNQSRTPPIKKTTPICLPSFNSHHMEILHVQNIVLEAII